MRLLGKKSSKASRKAMAFVLSLALGMSAVAVSPSADAASKKEPILNAKNKTLYYNKSGANVYTLKVKKNKVKAIKNTTWKTSSKSVVAISNKKNTSVKLTAKKAGKAKITATVKYTLKGSKKAKSKKLTCTINVKSYQGGVATPEPVPSTVPSANPTVVPTTAPTTEPTTAPTTAPTATPTAEPTTEPTTEPTAEPTTEPMSPSAVTVVEVESTTKTISLEAGKNTVTLKATVKDQYGEEMQDQTVVWSSGNDEVATVDAESGLVTAKAVGNVTITATVGEGDDAKTGSCVVTVEADDIEVITDKELLDEARYYAAGIKSSGQIAEISLTDLLGDIDDLSGYEKITVTYSIDTPEGYYSEDVNTKKTKYAVYGLDGNQIGEDKFFDEGSSFEIDLSAIGEGTEPLKVKISANTYGSGGDSGKSFVGAVKVETITLVAVAKGVEE